MSRTYRRKNYELCQNRSSCRKGRRVNGYYVEREFHWENTNGHSGHWVFRPMTQAEYNKEYWRIHGESKHNNAWGPHRFLRNRWHAEIERVNAEQLRRHLNTLGEYDPVFYGKGPSKREMWNW